MSFKKKIKQFLVGEDACLIQQIKPLVQDGVNRDTIAKTFGLSESKAKRLVLRAKAELEAEGKKVPNAAEIAWKSRNRRFEGDCIIEEPAACTYIEVPDVIGLDRDGRGYTLDEKKVPPTSFFIPVGGEKKARLSTIDEVRGLLDKGFDSYEIAKIKQRTPITTKRLVQQAEGTFAPVSDWVKKAAYRGIRLSELEKALGIQGLKRATQILEENFPKCFVIKTEVKNDLFLTPVYDSAEDFEQLRAPGLDKPFKYHVSMEKDYLYVKFDDDLPEDTIEIFNISDIHVGSKAHRESLFDLYIELIATRPNAFGVLGGDLGEFLTKTSVGDPLDAYMGNTEQMLTIGKKLKPISHKLLNWVYSNHDDGRTEKTAQVRAGEIMANMVGVPYFRQQTIIDLEFRGIRKTVLHTHNFGRAFEESSIMSEIRKRRAYFNFEINAFMSGHTHKSFVRREDIDNKILGRGMETGCYWVLNSGSTYARKMTYAQREGYSPTTQDLTYYMFDDTGKDAATTIPVHSL